MSRVIQIRGVSEQVHDALAEAAREHGLSLAAYLRAELHHLARRAQVVRDNTAVVRQTQADVAGRVDRSTILSALHEGRGV